MFIWPGYKEPLKIEHDPTGGVEWRLNVPLCFTPPTTIQAAHDATKSAIEYQDEGLRNHYQNPDETLRRGKGDCEDYAVFEYAILREMGFTDMLVLIGYFWDPDLRKRVQHAILIVDGSPLAEPFAIDNRSDFVYPARHAYEWFAPFFGVNENGCWVYLK